MSRADLPERVLPDWPRLMPEGLAAAYLGIGTTKLRTDGPQPKRLGARVLWDRRDLDRWADRLDGQPLTAGEQQAEASSVEDSWLRRRGHARG